MNILREVLKNEVYPALGCTEPVSIAYACAMAGKLVKNKNIDDISIEITLDPGTYKNGYAVNLPNTNNKKGNYLAAGLGFLISKPELRYKIFSNADETMIKKAEKMIKQGRIKIEIDYTKKEIFVEVEIKNKKEKSVCILSHTHFDVSLLSYNDKILKSRKKSTNKEMNYREFLKNLKLSELIEIADKASDKDLSYIEEGINMNLKIAEEGLKLDKTGKILKKIYDNSELYSKAKIVCSAATDARMYGLPMPVMSSGQSGNQGVVAILLPYLYGTHKKIDKKKIIKSIALAHLINSYIKTYLGELSPICGCAVSSGVGAACAIVYQEEPKSIKKIENAAKNVIADIGGMFCDGAKDSCALKVASSCDSAIRSAMLAINNWATSPLEGFSEVSLENTIKNLARLSIVGMSSVDSIIIDTMSKKYN